MKEYLMTLVGASLLTGSVSMIAPVKHRAYVRLLCGLCMICVIAAPISTLLSEVELPSVLEGGFAEEEHIYYDEIYNQTIRDADASALEIALQTAMTARYSVTKEELSVFVSLSVENGKTVLKKVTVGLRGSAVAIDPRAIAAYLEETVGCGCEIVYE